MSCKVEFALRASGDSIVFVGEDRVPASDDASVNLLAALRTNIRESLDEIEILRGTVQYWESRRAVTDAKERSVLVEAFRVMHGELLGLTARMKDLLNSTELAPGA